MVRVVLVVRQAVALAAVALAAAVLAADMPHVLVADTLAGEDDNNNTWLIVIIQ